MAAVTDWAGLQAGVLLRDEATLRTYAQDAGHVQVVLPAAVLRPTTAADVQAAMAFCGAHRIPAVARGLGNTTGGQSLVEGGLVIDCGAISTVAVGADSAVVGAGATWLDVARAAHLRGLAIPAATGYLALTIGGTLSLGGIPPAFSSGAQVDHVRELEVVTGDGALRRCSPTVERELFEAVLGGLGQFGVITEAVVDLVPAPQRVRGHSLAHTDRAAFFADLRTLVERGEVTEVYGEWWRPGEPRTLQHVNAFTFYDTDTPPDDAHILRGLSGVVGPVTDAGYLEHITRIDDAIDDTVVGLRAELDWDARVKPWHTVWLPDATVEQHVGSVLDGLTPRDVGVGGFVLLYVHRRALLTRPSLRLPATDGTWAHLFTLMSAGTDDEFAADMLVRNRKLYERARAAGGVRYPIETVPFTQADWRDHYGERWAPLVALARRVDPEGVLARIFA